MPQPTQHPLIHVLLLWITILSVVQVVFITLFFTAGHHSLSQNSSAVAAGRPMQFQENNTPSSPSQHGRLLGKGKMLTFQATEVNRKIKWVANNPHPDLVSEEGGGNVLTIKDDGYFFLSLQVTLLSCSSHTVILKGKDKVILRGSINNTITCSTGFLGKVVQLNALDTLEVTINLTTSDEAIDEAESHLDIIYMP